MSTINKEVHLGQDDIISDDEFEPKNVKIKISMFLDGDILDACKAQADKKGMGYQTLINQMLREVFIDGKKKEAEFEARLADLESKFELIGQIFDEKSYSRKKTTAKKAGSRVNPFTGEQLKPSSKKKQVSIRSRLYHTAKKKSHQKGSAA